MNPPLPEMSRHEASWHEHLAGMRAAEAARKQGANPAAIEALASVTAGPVQIGGYTLERASQGTVWTLQRVAREFAAFADANNLHPSEDSSTPGSRELIELGLAILVFVDSRACWLELDKGNLTALICRADDMIWAVPFEVQIELQKHFTAEMDRIASLAGTAEETPGKSAPAGHGISREIAIPSEAQESDPSSGLSPNTTFPSPMPSGQHPSQSG